MFQVTKSCIGQKIKMMLKKLWQPDLYDLLTMGFKEFYNNKYKTEYENKAEEQYQTGYDMGYETAYKEAYQKGYEDCRESRISEFGININELPDVPLEKLNLTMRSYHILRSSDIHTLKELIALSPIQLKHLKYMRKDSYIEIVSLLRKYGIDTTIYGKR